ncbi:iron complex transport system substrate-binding protein [Salibacterium halotolerans]|uniref:Iron complex transport system substrate-binding protein n=2 Tax=Salibacterium halotolerans TaxID=1884432 RepID=A0A1I5NWH8_9BACI|nr:ABC transporter substrate-binding protein [Salibacterium halotolerans]SFP26158.1 iron complex transport system substrate-binding protein [Salibacterium halotolerans]
MKQRILPGFCLMLVLITTGCSTGENAEEAQTSGENEQTEKEDSGSENDAFPVEITDAADETVTLEKEPERIVSMIPSNTEIAYKLGLGEEIVGVSDHADYPEEAVGKEKIGGLQFNVEKIISLEPDLVLAHASSLQQSEQGLEQIEEAGINVLVVNEAASFQETYDSINMIAKAAGAQQEAQNIISSMKTDVENLREQASSISEEEKKTVWMEIQPPPDIYTTGSGTFQHKMLQLIHAKNAAASEEGWLPYTTEDAVKQSPEVIITTYGQSVEGNPAAQIKNRKGWSSVPAVENGDIYNVNSNLVSRPGPRLVEGAEKLAELIYPDVFNE